ncbi:hypothetical protein CALCODRAFT_546083 [Calocera cornea HHB12733]|uniref:Uncharacterized protein n=1 Tax=Calocera cornea HHB12733 TaxID=1353952 RepID=A0A165ES05_9BASI|nr:hypothetical protein CALCODRAFT_546083 [Calocera cornea HHB12733]
MQLELTLRYSVQMTSHVRQSTDPNDTGSRCAGPLCVSLVFERSGTAAGAHTLDQRPTSAADTYVDELSVTGQTSDANDLSAKQPPTAGGRPADDAEAIQRVIVKDRPGWVSTHLEASAPTAEAVEQRDFNKPSSISLRDAASRDSVFRLRVDSEASTPIRFWDGPDADTASTAVSVYHSEAVEQRDFNKPSSISLRDAASRDSVFRLRVDSEASTPIRFWDGPDADTASTAVSAYHSEAVEQYDFNKPSNISLQVASPDDAVLRLWDNSEVSHPIRFWDGPDANTASTAASVRGPDAVEPNNLSKSHGQSSGERHYSPDERIASIHRRMEAAEERYRHITPDSAAEAAVIECRLACIEIMRRAVQLQEEQENPTAPPPYDPAWRHSANISDADAAASSTSAVAVPAGHTANAARAKPAEFEHDIRIYADHQALQQYREARRDDFKRYREAHGLTTIASRISSWWKNLYGGLTFDELKP